MNEITIPERRAALRVAAAALENRANPVKVKVTVSQGPNAIQAEACFRWPGVLCMRCYGGLLIARSVSGQPEVFDQTGTAFERAAMAVAPVIHDVFTLAERAAALRIGAAVLLDSERLPRALVTVMVARRHVRAEAVWRMPGIVVLRKLDTDAVLAQSRPGQPAELAESTL